MRRYHFILTTRLIILNYFIVPSLQFTATSLRVHSKNDNMTIRKFIGSKSYPSSMSIITTVFQSLPSDDSNIDATRNDLIAMLENDLLLIGALEERNKAQLDSFVNEQDQWESMEEEERDFLSQKDDILSRLDQL
mmetsp:Transcript_29152/g.33478  ORF Transcript_29152/g.33478 Transcript_29152/m.33478 type:complete len:135 (+) Transcript_29152:108-512(+)